MRPKCREKVDAGLMHPPLNNANKARLDRSVGVEGSQVLIAIIVINQVQDDSIHVLQRSLYTCMIQG